MASILTIETPAGTPTADNTVCLGTVFYIDAAVTISKLRYWKVNSTWNTQSIEMGLWSPAGSLLASASRVQLPGDALGWIELTLSSPIQLFSLGDTNLYTVASKTGGTNLGNYAFTAHGFAGTYHNSPFHVPLDGGRFSYSASLTRPTSTTDANYFADVVTSTTTGSASMSIADEARANMLTALSLSSSSLSNVDLMRLVLETPGQTLVVDTDETAAIQYAEYLRTVRDS